MHEWSKRDFRNIYICILNQQVYTNIYIYVNVSIHKLHPYPEAYHYFKVVFWLCYMVVFV